MSGTLIDALKAISVVLDAGATELESLGSTASTQVARQLNVLGFLDDTTTQAVEDNSYIGWVGFGAGLLALSTLATPVGAISEGIGAGATGLAASWVTAFFADTEASLLGSFVAAEISSLASLMAAVAEATINFVISEGVAGLIALTDQAGAALAGYVKSLLGQSSAVYNGTATAYDPDLPTDLPIWESPSGSIAYTRYTTSLVPTNLSIGISTLSDGTVQAVGSTPAGPGFTLTFNADGTVNEAVRSVTLNASRNFLDGNANVQISGVLSVGPGITTNVATTSFANNGTVSIGDPTTLTLSSSGGLQNNGVIEIAAGSTLIVTSPVSEDFTQVAPISETPVSPGLPSPRGTGLGTFSAQGVLSLGDVTTAPIVWLGSESEPEGDFRWQATYEKMATSVGAITNPALIDLGAQTAAGLQIVPGFPQSELAPAPEEVISYSFSSPVSATTPFFLWGAGVNDHGIYEDGTEGTLPGLSGFTNAFYHGPYTFTFSASLAGVPVSTAGWTFEEVSPLTGASPTATYSFDASTGVLTVTNYQVGLPYPNNVADAIVVAIPNTPIDSITVTANTTFNDNWGLALPSPAGETEIGDGATAEFNSSMDVNQTVTFGSDANLVLDGGSASFNAVISNFSSGDAIHYTKLTLTLGSVNSIEGIQQVGLSSGGSFAGDINFSSSTNLSNLVATPDGAGGTFVTLGALACFVVGTRIATSNGETPVEDIMVGDVVRAHFAGNTPVKWIGRRRIDCRRHPEPEKIWPVRVSAAAFGEHCPLRDLWLSPDHAVFADGALIPIRCLINGATIRQEPVPIVVYYHIELHRHDVVLADGLPAESYLDMGDRSIFDNAGSVIRLFPDFVVRPHGVADLWETNGCARLVLVGPQLTVIRRRLDECARLLTKHTSSPFNVVANRRNAY